MRVITAPETWAQHPGEVSVFLAGGITGTENWQLSLVQQIRRTVTDVVSSWLHGLVLINPRRVGFDVENASMSDAQIAWEHTSMSRCDVVLFWFPPETLCPIALFELGWCLAAGKPLIVGCDPGYKRTYDVRQQTFLKREEGVEIVDTLEGLIFRLRDVMKEFRA